MHQNWLIYRRRDRQLQLLASTDTKEGVGTTIVTLWCDREFDRPGDRLGVMYRREGKVGRWVVSPFGDADLPTSAIVADIQNTTPEGGDV